MILALTPLKLGFYSFRGACSLETRVMSLIRSPVVTSRSLFQTVGYQVTCMHITVSLITFIELLSTIKRQLCRLYTLLCQLCTLFTRSAVNIYSVVCTHHKVSCEHHLIGQL